MSLESFINRTCVDCWREGKYHIQTTEEDYRLCEKHMLEAHENTRKISEEWLKENIPNYI